MRGACSMPVGDRAAGFVGPAFVVLTNPGNGAAGRRHRDAVRSDARVRSPDGLRIASRERRHWLDCRSARLLQFNLLSLFPWLASPVHAGPGARPGTPLPQARNHIEYFKEITGFMFWFRRAVDYPALAFGGASGLPFVHGSAPRQIALSVSVQLLIYPAGAVPIALGFRGASISGFFRR